MSQSQIVLPAVVQALLSFVVLVLLGPARARSMRERKQTMEDADVRVGRNAWSEQALKISNNYKNQFELPVLFFAVVAFALILRQADAIMVGLAWVFALTRIVHAAVHIGPNVVVWRGLAFLVGAAALLAMWLVIGWRVLTGVA
jgi:hypothetical protein